MAETTNKKAGRPKKNTDESTTTASKNNNGKVVDKKDTALEDAMKLIAKMQEELNELKSEKKETTTISQQNGQSKKVKCISISHHPVNISTQPNLNGKVFKFTKYGQVVQMKYDELLDVIASYPNTMETGLIYICDKDIVEDNGLTEAYEHIYSKDVMDKIVYMREESDADLVLGLNDDLRESTVIKITQLYKDGERMDANALALLRDNGIDIVELAKETIKS